MAGADFTQNRGRLSAVSLSIGAAGMETATGWWVDWVTYFAFQDSSLPGFTRFGSRHGGKERLSIRVRGVLKYLFRFTYFYYFAQVHNGNMGSYVLEHS